MRVKICQGTLKPFFFDAMVKTGQIACHVDVKMVCCSLVDYLGAVAAGAVHSNTWCAHQVFNVQMVQVSGAEVSSGWCADDGSWCISMTAAPLHPWHVIHILKCSAMFT